MHKPDQPIQKRNAVFHVAMACVQQGYFYTARRLVRIMEASCEVELTADQRTAVVEAGRRSVRSRGSVFGRGLAGLWAKWLQSLGREPRSR